MDRKPTLLDRWGKPVQRSVLKKEVAAAEIGSVRSPISGTPADGLDPMRLASILRAADEGEPTQFLELAEVTEERDPHYLGVLGTRRRSVSQLDISVEPASDDPHDVKIADMVRDWLKRDELEDELFEMLDALGKGYSFTEIIWDTSEGQWLPSRLEWRDPRWFTFDRIDLTTPMKLGAHGERLPLDPFKFIYANIKAKSGLALRSGLARVAAWGWMFKAYTQRDWAIFTQTYGQPIRVGKWGAGASEDDKDTLFNAVANIAGDCAAIIPQSMEIDFIESANVGSAHQLYKERADWLDQQISKAVLGQTTSTDAISGGHAVSKEHREVQGDIERADAKSLTAIINRDLIRPWVDLEYGPQRRYPRVKIGRQEAEDLEMLTSALERLVPLGLEVEEQEVRGKFGLSEPKPGAKLLAPSASVATSSADMGRDQSIERQNGDFERSKPSLHAETPDRPQNASQGKKTEVPPDQLLADQLEERATGEIAALLETVEEMLSAANSLSEFQEMLLAAYPDLDTSHLTEIIAEGLLAGHALGRAALEADSD